MHISDRDWRWSLEKYICLRTANDLWAAFHSSISQVEKFLPLLCSYNLYFVRGYLWEVMQPWAVLCETWCMSCVHECKYRNKINKYGNFITGRLRLAKFEAPLKRLWRGRKTEEPGLLPFNFFFFFTYFGSSSNLVPYYKDISGYLSVRIFILLFVLFCLCSEQMYADATVVGTFERNGFCVTADCKLKCSVTYLV